MAKQDWIGNFRDMFAQARELLPKFRLSNIPGANMRLGKMYLERGATQDAIVRYRIVTWFEPKNADAWTGLGIAYLMEGKDFKAEAAIRRALMLQPGNPPAVAALEELKAARKAPTPPQP